MRTATCWGDSGGVGGRHSPTSSIVVPRAVFGRGLSQTNLAPPTCTHAGVTRLCFEGQEAEFQQHHHLSMATADNIGTQLPGQEVEFRRHIESVSPRLNLCGHKLCLTRGRPQKWLAWHILLGMPVRGWLQEAQMSQEGCHSCVTRHFIHSAADNMNDAGRLGKMWLQKNLKIECLSACVTD